MRLLVRSEQGAESTVIVWERQEDVGRYLESDLIKEAIAFEQRLGLETTREGYPVSLRLA